MQAVVFSLAQELGHKLLERKLTLSTAESCTGGGIARALTQVPGASGWYCGGLVTYSNALKTELLEVDHAVLKAEGAVSESVVTAMVRGCLKITKTDVSVAVSGIAGPGGGSPDKPVGTVCIAWGCVDDIRSKTLKLHGDREEIQASAVLSCLHELCEHVSGIGKANKE